MVDDPAVEDETPSAILLRIELLVSSIRFYTWTGLIVLIIFATALLALAGFAFLRLTGA